MNDANWLASHTDAAITELRESWVGAEAAMTGGTCGLTTVQLARLEHACTVVWQALGGTYLVGSAAESSTFHDVDIRTVLPDKEFDALFLERKELWSLLCHAVGEYLSSVSGLPVDYQVQRMTEANERFGGRPRNPIGHGHRHYAGLGDATPWLVNRAPHDSAD